MYSFYFMVVVQFQLPDVLPSLKADKERPVVKLEPGTTSQKSDESAATSSAAEKSQSENVFEDTPEGRLGTLRIHQSGKVTLQMGNHSFVIDSATQVPFLQVSIILFPHKAIQHNLHVFFVGSRIS